MINKEDYRYKLKKDFLNIWSKDKVHNDTLEQ